MYIDYNLEHTYIRVHTLRVVNQLHTKSSIESMHDIDNLIFTCLKLQGTGPSYSMNYSEIATITLLMSLTHAETYNMYSKSGGDESGGNTSQY